MTDLNMLLGGGLWKKLGLERLVNVQSLMGCSVRAWKIRMLLEMKIMKAWLMKFIEKFERLCQGIHG